MRFVQLGEIGERGPKIAPFKNNYGDFVGLANTTDVFADRDNYNIRQCVQLELGDERIFNWPSAEHAYHAQKIIQAVSKLLQKLKRTKDDSEKVSEEALYKLFLLLRKIEGCNEKFLPRSTRSTATYHHYVNDFLGKYGKFIKCETKNDFDAFCEANYYPVDPQPKHGLPGFKGAKNPDGIPYTIIFMERVLVLKLKQHKDLRNKVMQMAEEGIMPVEFSNHDRCWASGPKGDGENFLGCLLLKIGNKFLEQAGRVPAIPNPKQYYDELRAKYQKQLKHNSLDKVHRKLMGPKPKRESDKTQRVQQLTLEKIATMLGCTKKEIDVSRAGCVEVKYIKAKSAGSLSTSNRVGEDSYAAGDGSQQPATTLDSAADQTLINHLKALKNSSFFKDTKINEILEHYAHNHKHRDTHDCLELCREPVSGSEIDADHETDRQSGHSTTHPATAPDKQNAQPDLAQESMFEAVFTRMIKKNVPVLQVELGVDRYPDAASRKAMHPRRDYLKEKLEKSSGIIWHKTGRSCLQIPLPLVTSSLIEAIKDASNMYDFDKERTMKKCDHTTKGRNTASRARLGAPPHPPQPDYGPAYPIKKTTPSW